MSPVNDIAVVRLDRHIRLPGLVSVCLPSPAHPVSLSGKLSVAGWGATKTNTKANTKAKAVTQLQYTQLDTTPVSACQVVPPVSQGQTKSEKYLSSGEIQQSTGG